MKISTCLIRFAAAGCLLGFVWTATAEKAQRDPLSGGLIEGAMNARSGDLTPVGVRGPLLGFLWDAQNGLEPVMGLPGAFYRTPSVVLPEEVVSVTANSEHGYALLVVGASRQLILASGLAGEAVVSQVADIPEGVTGVVLSPSGGEAAILSAGELFVVGGLPASPSVTWSTTLASLPGVAAGLALSDGGETVLIAADDGATITVLTAGPDSDWRYVTSVSQGVSLAFLRGLDDAVLADAGANQVIMLRGVSDGGFASVVATEADGVAAPVGVSLSRDNSRLVVAVSEPGGVVSVGLESGIVERAECNCTPAGLELWNGNSVFRIAAEDDGPAWVFDGDTEPSRLLVVPPGELASAQSSMGGAQ